MEIWFRHLVWTLFHHCWYLVETVVVDIGAEVADPQGVVGRRALGVGAVVQFEAARLGGGGIGKKKRGHVSILVDRGGERGGGGRTGWL